MARRHHRRDDEVRPLQVGGVDRTVEVDGRSWTVRNLRGDAAGRTYRCPGCNQEVPSGSPHVVAWPTDVPDGAEQRRHWHTPCWTARDRLPRR